MLNKIYNQIIKNSFEIVKFNADAVFFLTTGRTGTTTVKRLLELSPEILALHEPKPQLFLERKQIYDEASLFAPWIEKCFKRARGLKIISAFTKGALYAETSGFMSFFTPVIHEILPKSKFVFVYRHPADFVRSGMLRRWYDCHPNDPNRLVPLPGSNAALKWDQWSQFEKICCLWSSYNEYCLKCLESMKPERTLSFASEDMWSEPIKFTNQLCKFLNVGMPEESKIIEIFGRKYNAQNDGEFAKLNDWSLKEKSQLTEIASNTMKKLGYEQL